MRILFAIGPGADARDVARYGGDKRRLRRTRSARSICPTGTPCEMRRGHPGQMRLRKAKSLSRCCSSCRSFMDGLKARRGGRRRKPSTPIAEKHGKPKIEEWLQTRSSTALSPKTEQILRNRTVLGPAVGRNRPSPDGCRFPAPSAINPASRRPAQGLPWRREVLNQHAHFEQITGEVGRKAAPLRPEKESKMPKMKTKSGAKKRFKITGTGKVIYAAARQAPRHDQADQEADPPALRGTSVMFKTDGDNVKKYFLPNG